MLFYSYFIFMAFLSNRFPPIAVAICQQAGFAGD